MTVSELKLLPDEKKGNVHDSEKRKATLLMPWLLPDEK
jgi:hypothetical protein